jgi:hypothetical protein
MTAQGEQRSNNNDKKQFVLSLKFQFSILNLRPCGPYISKFVREKQKHVVYLKFISVLKQCCIKKKHKLITKL